MDLAGWLAAVAVGLLAGGVSGLVGIGGGIVMVPFLYLLFGHPEWFGVSGGAEREAVLAHATSLFVIVPTAIRGTWLYHRARLVEWRAVWALAAGSVVGAAVAARTADRLPGTALQLGFALFLLLTAARLWRPAEPLAARPVAVAGLPYAARGLAGGVVVGVLSALLGVGGGIIAIPILLHLLEVDVRRVAATSLAVIVLTAAAGAASYALAVPAADGVPAGSVGYVYLPAAVALTAGTVVAVRWGTILNRRLDAGTLRLVFAVTLALVGVLVAARALGGPAA